MEPPPIDFKNPRDRAWDIYKRHCRLLSSVSVDPEMSRYLISRMNLQDKTLQSPSQQLRLFLFRSLIAIGSQGDRAVLNKDISKEIEIAELVKELSDMLHLTLFTQKGI